MKLFENKVGRPSNEVIKKRKKFYIGITFVIVFLILGISLAVYGNINNNAAVFQTQKVTFADNAAGSKIEKGKKVKVTASFLNIGGTKYYKLLKNGKTLRVNSGTCNKFRTLGGINLNFTMQNEDVKYEIIVYSDSSCTKKLKSFKSKTYRAKEKTSKIDLDIFKIDKNSIEVIRKIVSAIKKPSSTGSISMSRFTNSWIFGSEGVASVKMTSKNDTFEVKSSNPSVFVVVKESSTTFRLKAVGEGQSTITVTSNNTGKTDSYTYSVKPYELPSLSRFGNYSNQITLKGTYNGIPVYVHNACSKKNINRINASTGKVLGKVNGASEFVKDINRLDKYVTKAIKGIYIVDKNAFNTANKSNTNSSGLAHAGVVSYIDFKCETYSPTTVAHEAGHAIDYRYKSLTGSMLSDSFESLYKKYYSASGRPLRKYSYTNLKEFFAESYASYSLSQNNIKLDWKYPSDLKNETIKAINKVKSIGW